VLERVLRDEASRSAPPKEKASERHVSPDGYGALTEPATLKIQRLLPGPIERVWAYLTESNLAASGSRQARCR